MKAAPILAAIHAAKDVPVDPLLAEIAARGKQDGLRVAGFSSIAARIRKNVAVISRSSISPQA